MKRQLFMHVHARYKMSFLCCGFSHQRSSKYTYTKTHTHTQRSYYGNALGNMVKLEIVRIHEVELTLQLSLAVISPDTAPSSGDKLTRQRLWSEMRRAPGPTRCPWFPCHTVSPAATQTINTGIIPGERWNKWSGKAKSGVFFFFSFLRNNKDSVSARVGHLVGRTGQRSYRDGIMCNILSLFFFLF